MTGIGAELAGERLVKFTVPLASGRKVHMEGLREPLDIGVPAFLRLGEDITVINRVFTPGAHLNWGLALAKPEDYPALLQAWGDAVGLGEDGVQIMRLAIQHLDLIEADLHMFYQLDVLDWLAGKYSTRKIMSLVQGLRRRPESLFGAEISDIDPMARGEIILAQIAGGMSGKPHSFLTAKVDRRVAAEEAEKMQRMASRGLSA